MSWLYDLACSVKKHFYLCEVFTFGGIYFGQEFKLVHYSLMFTH